jgi:hypothetical protein
MGLERRGTDPDGMRVVMVAGRDMANRDLVAVIALAGVPVAFVPPMDLGIIVAVAIAFSVIVVVGTL